MTIDRERSAATPDVLSDTQRVRVSIARAKFEWETTVDALPDLICLLDSAGRVARVNRVVERWNLGSITGVLGRDLQNEIMRREAAEQALRRSRNELEILSRQQIAAQENERKRIARELHDSVGQQVSAIKYSLERIELPQHARTSESQLQVLRRAITGLQDVLEELRGIAMNLRPAVLDDLGAASAVSWFCREFAESYPTLQLHEQVSVRDAEVPERLGTAVFRSVQELLNNVAKHAQAHKVIVSLSRRIDRLVLEVDDDGVGLGKAAPPAALRSGRGIHNLRERAEMTGGHLTLSSGTSGTGSHARIEWRLAAAESPKAEGA